VTNSSSERPRPTWGTLTSSATQSNDKWWPEGLNLKVLHPSPRSNPMGEDFDYVEAFEGIDLEALTADVDALMTDSQDWWPADWGHYGPFFIRMAWHAAGTYRQHDGRGGAGTGAQRFAPLNSWPDNGNLDKARRLLWPIKRKYGQQISWADLFVFTGNRALETMGFKTLGFGGGRADIYSPEDDIYWGPEDEWLGDGRYSSTDESDRVLDEPLAAVQMGLIYVNPEGPNGVPDALAQAQDVRETFKRMGMNDEETVALTVGGHTFGKMHGAGPADLVGAEPEKGMMEDQGLGWTSKHGTGKGADTVTSGLEGAWTPTPTKWDNTYLEVLFKYQWEIVESPAGAKQWEPKDIEDEDLVPDAHIEGKMNKPVMNTADMAMIVDPAYLEISKRFHENPDQLADAFAHAWFKLTHRDMGPIGRYHGPLVPDEEFIWQDPVPAVDHELVGDSDIADLKQRILDSGLSVQQLVATAWASASTFRTTDKRGGANGARIRLEPQASWDVNVRSGVGEVVAKLEEIQQAFNEGGKRISLADLIVLGGCAGVEKAAKDAGHDVTVPFTPGRTDATQDQTDVETFQYLEPKADGFRNYQQKQAAVPTEHLLIDKAFMLELSAPQMTALVGGLRAIGINADGEQHGIFTDRPGKLTNDFFVNLLDMGIKWMPADKEEVGDEDVDSYLFEGTDYVTGQKRWTATRADLVFGSNSQLRAVAEVYGADDCEAKFVEDFVTAWDNVMMLDRFDVKN
jgi:catalase-peroxidase